MKSHDVTGNVELLDVYDGLGSAAAIPPFQAFNLSQLQ